MLLSVPQKVARGVCLLETFQKSKQLLQGGVPPLYAAAREGVGSAGAEAEDELRPCDNDNDYDDNDNDNEDDDKMNPAPRHWRLAKLRH